MKKLLFLAIGFIIGITALVSHAAPITPVTGGGTNTSTKPSTGSLLVGANTTTTANSQYGILSVGTNGQCPIASSTAPLGIAWGSCGSGGSGSISTSSATSTGYFPNWVGSGLLSVTSSLYQQTSTGNIGVLNTNPGYTLDLGSTGVLNLNGLGVALRRNGAATLGDGSAIGGAFSGYTRFVGPGMIFSGMNDGTSQITITSSTGNVTIGSSAAGSSTLHVVGTFQVTQTSTLTGNIVGGAAMTLTNGLIAGSLQSNASTITAAGSEFYWNTRSTMASLADGKLILRNNADTDFTALQFASSSANGLSIKTTTSTKTFAFRNGDDSADANLTAASGTFSGQLNVQGIVQFTNSSTVSVTVPTGALLVGACDSATTTIDSSYPTSTTGIALMPQADAGDSYYYKAFISSPGVLTAKVCAVAAGTPATTTLNIKLIR